MDTIDPIDEAPVAGEAYVPTREDEIMAAIDAALLPARNLTKNLGLVGHHELAAVIASFRQALAVIVNGPPAHPTPEPVDALAEQRKAQAEANVGHSEPQFVNAEAEAEVDPVADPLIAPEAGGADPVADPLT